MGIEIGIGLALLSAVTSIAGGVAAASESSKATAATNQSLEEQRKARRIAAAQQKFSSIENRRQAIREQRIRRARIIAQSENTGTTDSSGQIGAVGALSTNLANRIGTSLGQSNANQAISNKLINASQFDGIALQHTANANQIGAWTGAISGGFNAFSSASLNWPKN